MLTMAAPSSFGGPVVTDDGGAADVRRASTAVLRALRGEGLAMVRTQKWVFWMSATSAESRAVTDGWLPCG